jgi:hypothetical protein
MRVYTHRRPAPPAPPWTGGSTGTLGHRLAEAWGGPESGSWLTTKLPDNTAIHVDNDAAVASLVLDTKGVWDPVQQRWENYWGNPVTPWINESAWTIAPHVVPGDQPWVPTKMVGSATGTSHGKPLESALAQVPIPPGIQPTNDSDATISIYMPDYTHPAGPQYNGQLWELFGAASPEMNAAAGKPAIWTYHWGGRMRGVNVASNTGRGHWRNVAYDPSTTSPVWQVEGLGEAAGWGAKATSIPYMALIITRRDLVRGVIDHPIGFMLDPARAADYAGPVWPAQRNDGSSRRWLPQGSRLRLPAGYNTGSLSIQPLQPGQRRTQAEVKQMVETAKRDYGIVFIDTTLGGGMALRAEKGARALLPSVWDPKAFMQSLSWGNMQRLKTGSDSNYNVTA